MKNILFTLLALLITSGAFAQSGSKLSTQSADVERKVYENTKAGLDKYDGLEILYLVKLGGLKAYPNEDIPELEKKMSTIKYFKSVEISSNDAETIYITTTGNCQPEILHKSLIDQGFEVYDFSGELKFK